MPVPSRVVVPGGVSLGTPLFEGELLLAVETPNLDAASFAQMSASVLNHGRGEPDVAHIVLRAARRPRWRTSRVQAHAPSAAPERITEPAK